MQDKFVVTVTMILADLFFSNLEQTVVAHNARHMSISEPTVFFPSSQFHYSSATDYHTSPPPKKKKKIVGEVTFRTDVCCLSPPPHIHPHTHTHTNTYTHTHTHTHTHKHTHTHTCIHMHALDRHCIRPLSTIRHDLWQINFDFTARQCVLSDRNLACTILIRHKTLSHGEVSLLP